MAGSRMRGDLIRICRFRHGSGVERETVTKARRHDHQARIKRDGDICRAKAWILLRSTSREPSPPPRGTGPISPIPSREEVEWGMDPRGVDQMKGLLNVGAAARLRIRECTFWPCSISHHPRITHITNAPFNGHYCGNGCSQVTMLQGSHSGMGERLERQSRRGI